jgi:hypothetical protein
MDTSNQSKLNQSIGAHCKIEFEMNRGFSQQNGRTNILLPLVHMELSQNLESQILCLEV